jgi:hypothetical protein
MWVKSLVAQGLKPEIVVFEEHIDLKDLNDSECFWIEYWRFLGACLKNTLDGGEGWFSKHSTKTRIAMSLRRAGPTHEQRKEMATLYVNGLSSTQIGKIFGFGAKAVLRAIALEGVEARSPAEGRALRPTTRGKSLSKTHRVKIAQGFGTKPFVELASGLIFHTKIAAAKHFGITIASITKVLSGEYKQSKGHRFEYVSKT